MLSPVLAGLGLGFSLIVAIGAQNLFVLRQGLRREHVLAVAAICAISDAVLIVLGVSGIGLVLQAAPWLVDVVRWAGALFLVTYGVLAARRAWRPSGETLNAEGTDAAAGPTRPGSQDRPASRTTTTRTRLLPVILTCLALTWLNPHVYLDTVVLLGAVGSSLAGEARTSFAAGAMTASVLWITALGLGAQRFARVLGRPSVWRVIEGATGTLMLVLAVLLVRGA